MSNGQQVTYTYRKHYLLDGEVVSGTGTITGETIVGSEPAYIIKPADGSPSVHAAQARGERSMSRGRKTLEWVISAAAWGALVLLPLIAIAPLWIERAP